MRWLALLVLTGCIGDLSDQALRVGSISGQLVGAEASQARLFLLGNPQFVTRTDSAGRFTLSDVPVSDYQLVAVAPTTAFMATVHVTPGGVATPSTLGLSGASPTSVQAVRSGAPVSGVRVEIEGTPLSGTTSMVGQASLGVLPAGCFRLSGSLEGTSISCSVCATPPLPALCTLDFPASPDAGPVDAGPRDAGSRDDAGKFDAGPTDAGPVDAGPVDAGPQDGGWCSCGSLQVCDPDDGQCYDCLGPDDCSLGSVCVGHMCLSGGAMCQLCTPGASYAMCPDGQSCWPNPGTGDAGWGECVSPCADDGTCNEMSGYGYQCSSSNYCLPAPGEVVSCVSLAALGAPCVTTSDCVGAGLVLGSCADLYGDGNLECTVTCTNDGDCPSTWRCDHDEGVCYP